MGIVAHEEIEAITVDGQGEAGPGEEPVKQRHVAVDVFRGTELQSENLRRGVIHGAEEGESGAAGLQPRERTAVDLDQGPPRGFRWATAPRARRAPGALRRQAELTPDTPDGLASDGEAGLLAELLGEVGVVEADVHRFHQAAHPLAHSRRQPSRRRSAAIGVPQRRGAAGLELALEPLELSHAQSERGRRLAIGDPSRTEGFEQPGPMQFLPAQRESLHEGMTLSRSSYPMTFSCSSSTGRRAALLLIRDLAATV